MGLYETSWFAGYPKPMLEEGTEKTSHEKLKLFLLLLLFGWKKKEAAHI